MWRPKYVACGVRTDSDKLLQKFIENGDIKYKEFAKCWRELKFSLIFMGRTNHKEQTELNAECFRIAKMYWDPKYSFSYHIGGFFLLYGFYKKQISKPPDRIRIQMEEWKFLIDLMNICKEKKMYDVNYIFYIMCEENAFHFVYNSKMFGPKISLSDSDTIEQEVRWKEILMPLDSFSSSGELDQISTIHEKYQKLKESFDISISNSLSLIKDNIAGKALLDMKTFLQDTNKDIYKAKTKTNSNKSKEENIQKESEEENIGEHRALLRKKIFSDDLSLSRSRRTVLDDSKNEKTYKKAKYSALHSENSDDN